MAKERSMAFYVSFYELAKVLPEKSKNKFLASVLEYYFDGVEPNLNANEQRLFEAIRGRIDMAVQNCKNVKSRYGEDDSVPTTEPTDVPTTEPTDFDTTDCDSCGQSESESESMSKRESENKPKKRFVPPSVEDVSAHIAEKGYHFDAEAFVAFYESKGWKVGNQPMKSWKASCVTWEKRETGKGGGNVCYQDEYSAL